MKYLSSSLLLLTLTYSQMSLASVESDLVNDIKKAQTSLNKTQSSIAKQSTQLNRQTHDAEQAVITLRKQTSAARRLMDEQTLSLTTLEKRLATWQQQDTYQRNLLARFSQQQKMPQPTDDAASNDAFSNESLATLSSAFNRLRSQLNPQWQTTSVVAQDGAIKPVSTLAIGPVSWFIDQTNQQAGFLVHKPTMTKQGLLLGNNEFEQLNQLANGQQAQISFDPTLTRALKIAQSQESVVSHVEKGGIWVLPIIAFGIFALLISLAKGAQLIRLPTLLPALAERLSHIDGNDASQLNQFAEQVKGMQRQLIDITLKSPAGQQRDDQLFSALLMQKHTLEYWLGAVAITAAVSPLLGLLGTVSGMIETFKLMTLFGAGDASAVSGGISEALVTTELGLVVAIPALLMHALLSRKVKTYYGGLESCAVQLSQTSTKSLPKAA